jgi:YidC/Oxa1 family membrane protein insertase
MLVAANIFQPLIDFFEAILKFFHDSVGLSWGWSIIALTLMVRAALLPLTLKQFKSMQSLAQHQPELKRLQEKYKGDRDRLNQEMMKFYKENKINPLASCLPLVAQLPVFISLFYMLRVDLRHDICPEKNPLSTAHPVACGSSGDSGFFFINDLTSQAHGTVLIVLIVLYVGSQLLSSILMSTTVDRNQRMIMLALPFVFVLFVKGFPAGLLVYWITTNFWTVGQGWIMRRNAPPPPTPTPNGGAKPARGKPPSPSPTPAAAGAVAGAGSATAPPRPPRKKKKRSGRRR